MKAMTLDTQLSLMHGGGYEFVYAWFHILHSSVCISIIQRSPFSSINLSFLSVIVQKDPAQADKQRPIADKEVPTRPHRRVEARMRHHREDDRGGR